MLHPNAVKILNDENIPLATIRKIYFGDEKISMENKKKLADLQGDFNFIIGIHDVVDIQTKNLNNPTYFYQFNYDLGATPIKLFFGVDEPGKIYILLFMFFT